ncbi:MAG TPA: PIG-L family deacetylase [Anaerolineaceae bacterium]|nr:PIG-L family deacetylase [Anaerolineaceae bacterium]
MAVADAAGNVKDVKYPPVIEDFEGWNEKKKILVILAHPDDPEFFMGATLARWGALGHEIRYCLLTTGQKGSQEMNQKPEDLATIRKEEQLNAANTLKVKSVEFMNYVDGEVVPDLEMRKKIVRVIRKYKPQIVISSDPLNFFPGDNRVNHPDHRAAGQAVLDAVFPAAGNPMFFPELMSEENLPPVNVAELWFSIPADANLVVDVSRYFDDKIKAILCHKTQLNMDDTEFEEMLKTRWATFNEQQQPVYLERFRRIVFG